MKAIRTAIALALAGVSATAMAEIPEAQVTGGTVAGEVADGLSMFKGIPFAAPPTGDLRWKAPQPVVPWLGTRKTTSFGAGCMQDPGLAKQMGADVPLSEDCLFIDVWTPADTPADGLPVIAWIYGGGYNSGMTSVPLYDGANFARSGVVFVSISYRVGPFGFLATPELSAESGHGSGNYGMLDQIAGLKWVQENIAQFGGDPAKVTIMGHSAGGFAVSELAASPLAKGLFRGVISESGGNFAPPQGTPFAGSNLMTLPLAEANGKKWLAGLGAATLAEARALPAAELEKAQHAEGAPRFWPPMDGYVLPGDQYALYGEHRFNDVPVLIGANSDETSVFGGNRKLSPADFEAMVRKDYGKLADRILATHPHADEEQASRSAKQLASETSFLWNTYTWARMQTEDGEAPAYAYFFHRPTAQNPDGSGHGSEVALVFANEDARRAAWTDEDRALSQQLHGYWVNFAKTGNPNGSGLTEWPAFAPGRPTVMQLGAETKPIPVPFADRLEALGEYYAWRREGGK